MIRGVFDPGPASSMSVSRVSGERSRSISE
jgi:hypothetical protein